MILQSAAPTDFTQDGVGFAWVQPRFLPPTWTATPPWKPSDFQAFIAARDGAVQASKARPVKVFWAGQVVAAMEVCAATTVPATTTAPAVAHAR